MLFDNFFQSLGKATDILNFGRLIFYPVAGFFIFYPAFMIFKLLALRDSQLTTFLENLKDTVPTDFLIIFVGSLIVGFLIAGYGYVMVIEPLSENVKTEIYELGLEKNSFAYRYPFLRNSDSEDYQKWLIAEFYRFVEIVTFVPLGALIGLTLFFVYTVLYLLRHAIDKPFYSAGEGYAFLFILAVVLGIGRFYIWEDFWKPKVIHPTLRSYIKAKVFLIHGVEEYKKKVKASV